MSGETFFDKLALPSLLSVMARPDLKKTQANEILTGGFIVRNIHGVIGINLGIGVRQTRFWIPGDHPNFLELKSLVEDAVMHHRLAWVEFDEESHIVFNVAFDGVKV